MSRGYRYAIAAIVGFLILGNSPAQQERQSRGDSNHQVAIAPGKPQTQNPSYHQAANQGCKGTSRPDLACDAISAQASLDQAVDANAGFWLGIVQATIGVFTLGAAVAAAIFAWFAAHHTESAAKAAREANRIAKAGSELEYRPILIFDHLLIEKGAGVNNVHVTPVWKNTGKLPALSVTNHTYRGYVSGNPQPEDIARIILNDTPHNGPDTSIILAGNTRNGGTKAITPDKIGVSDILDGREITPAFLEYARNDPVGRYRSKNFTVIICRVTYKAAIGELPIIWETEETVALMPLWDDQGWMRHDMMANIIIRDYPTHHMT